MKFIAIVLSLFASAAFATDTISLPPAKPTQQQDQSQIQHQNQSNSFQNQQAFDQSVTFRDRRQTPPANAPAIYASGSCYVPVSLGVGLPGVAVSGGKTFKDEACENRENIRLAYSMGLIAEGDYLFCSTIGKDIPNCGVRPPLPPAPEQKPVVVVLQGDGCGQRYDEKLKRVLETCVSK